VRRVLVVDGERLVGLLSLDDVARSLGLRIAGPTTP
jgi:CBS domain-containing protein